MSNGGNQVEKVQKVLFEDSDLLIEFWMVIEKAIVKADVPSFKLEDRVALLRLVADKTEKMEFPAKPPIFWYQSG